MRRIPTASCWLLAAAVLAAFGAVPAKGGEARQAQEAENERRGGLTTRNPLDEIKDELIEALAKAGIPFTQSQEDSIILVLEESRRASEQLFGDVMDFRGGPPQGETLDRARAGIEWMNDDFSQRVRQYLEPEQLKTWDAHVAARKPEKEPPTSTAGTSRQVQQIRVNNNNAFTAENSDGGSFGSSGGGGVSAQIIQRGGTGGWHANSQFQIEDEALNARNPLANNKPPFQRRNASVGGNGPLIPKRLTITGSFSHSRQDNPNTVNAETLDGPFQLGFTQQHSTISGGGSGIYQLTKDQSVHFSLSESRNNYFNQGVGGTSLPERAIDYWLSNNGFSIRHFWVHSTRLVQDITFIASNNTQESVPRAEGVSINVLGSFSGGGGQNRAKSISGTDQLRALWIYTGKRFTLRTGGNLSRPSSYETSTNNFLGTFTFPNLQAYRDGLPTSYAVTGGDPTIEYSQTEWSAFVQNEQRVSGRFTLFYGLRYEWQSNLGDHNNVDPRFGLAYAIGSSTVVRSGVGVFHSGVSSAVGARLLQENGARQYEIVINNPSYPDPFQSGNVTIVPPRSRRVRADDLGAPYSINSSVQIERSLPANLFVTASFDYQRSYHLLRSRNLNAPLPGQTQRPDLSEGNVWQLESTGVSRSKAFRFSMRQRFSIFNVNANYRYEVDATDTVGSFGAPTDNYDFRADWASVSQHQFSTSINSQLPFDVYLTTNISWASGNPYTITTGYDNNLDGVFNDRPAGVSRNSERGPYRHNVTFNISKAFPIGESGMNVNMFANMDNAFNRTNLSTPISNRSSSRFGQYVSASNPRDIRAGIRFNF